MASSLADTDLRAVFAPLDITARISDVSSDVQRFGGLADIYEGILDADGGQVKVAIKFIRSNDRELEKIMRRHRREVKIWHDIKHPYILPLLGLYWGTRSLPAMVSTWCEYGNIRSYLQTLPSEPKGVVRKHELLVQIAEGLAHLHGQSPPVVHGDLKGDNILVSDDGIPKICDFGLSKITAVTTETMTHVRGTLRWMAPELLCDDPVATPASDIWAYACIMIEVFSGARPYIDKASDNAVVIALMQQKIPSRPADMSDACWNLARKCFEHNPNKRITAIEIIADPVFTAGVRSESPPSKKADIWSPKPGTVSADTSLPVTHVTLVPLPFIEDIGQLQTDTTMSYRTKWLVQPRILLADDDAMCRTITGRYLQHIGCSFDVVNDGLAAVNKLQLTKYDLVLMDIVMPTLDGLAATCLVRQFDSLTPIIAMTRSTTPEDVVNYFSHGMNDTLPKPFTVDNMAAMIKKHCNLMHMRAWVNNDARQQQRHHAMAPYQMMGSTVAKRPYQDDEADNREGKRSRFEFVE